MRTGPPPPRPPGCFGGDRCYFGSIRDTHAARKTTQSRLSSHTPLSKRQLGCHLAFPPHTHTSGQASPRHVATAARAPAAHRPPHTYPQLPSPTSGAAGNGDAHPASPFPLREGERRPQPLRSSRAGGAGCRQPRLTLVPVTRTISHRRDQGRPDRPPRPSPGIVVSSCSNKPNQLAVVFSEE
ncbi:uncharacterized protein PRD47_015718 isoform 1-T1 [Ara ararauna]